MAVSIVAPSVGRNEDTARFSDDSSMIDGAWRLRRRQRASFLFVEHSLPARATVPSRVGQRDEAQHDDRGDPESEIGYE